MKKLLLALLIAVSAPAFADKFVIERGQADDLNSPNNSGTWYMKGVIDVNKNLAVDASVQTTQVDNTNTVSSRADIGVVPKFNIYGPVNGYTRLAVGEKYSSTGSFSFYSIEPGVTAGLGRGFTGQVGWRFRNAFNTANNDTTRTLRTGVSYDLTKKDTVGVRLDNVRGDQQQNIWNLNYARSF